MKNKRLKIGVDGNEANIKNRVGSNVVAYEILVGLNRLDKRNQYTVFLKDKPLKDLPQAKDGWQYQVVGPKKLWTKMALPFNLLTKHRQLDLFLSLGHYSPSICPAPLAALILDLAYLKFPSEFRKKDLVQLKYWTAQTVKKAAFLFTISKATKKDIVNYYHFPKEKIAVIYPGATLSISNQSPITSRKLLSNLKTKSPYFLCLGTLQPRKNIEKLIEAFGLLLKTNSQYQLVIAGKKGWLYDSIFKKVEDLSLDNKVIFTNFVSEEEKTALLKSAEALVLPSLYEGFGLPVLEAKAIGCPVIVSSVSSLPEVGGQSAIYISEPRKTESILAAFQEFINLSSQRRKKLVDKGIIEAQEFSWDRSVKQIVDRLHKISNT